MSVSNQYLNSFFNKLMKNNVTYRSFEYNLKTKQLNNTRNINKFKSFYKLLIKKGYDKNIVETFFKDKRNIIDLLLYKNTPQRKKIFSNWYSVYQMGMNIPNPPTNEPSIKIKKPTIKKNIFSRSYTVPNHNEEEIKKYLNNLQNENFNYFSNGIPNEIRGGSKKRIKKKKTKKLKHNNTNKKNLRISKKK